MQPHNIVKNFLENVLISFDEYDIRYISGGYSDDKRIKNMDRMKNKVNEYFNDNLEDKSLKELKYIIYDVFLAVGSVRTTSVGSSGYVWSYYHEVFYHMYDKTNDYLDTITYYTNQNLEKIELENRKAQDNQEELEKLRVENEELRGFKETLNEMLGNKKMEKII